MATYYSGTASAFSDLQTAIQTACTDNGWTLSSTILSKSGVYFKLANASNYLRVSAGTGQSGSTLTGDALPYDVVLSSPSAAPISFPCSYEIHAFTSPDEIYTIINYNSSYYQQLTLGISNVPGIGGTGGIVSASQSWRTGVFSSSDGREKCDPILTGISHLGFYYSGYAGVPIANVGGLFVEDYQNSVDFNASYVHCALESTGWHGIGGSVGNLKGITYYTGILISLPSLFNNSTVLVPIKPIMTRSSAGRTVVANLKNARYCRNDNLTPGQVVTYGSDKWKVYPFYKKDAGATKRNGEPFGASAVYDHSGTFAYAIRYTGP